MSRRAFRIADHEIGGGRCFLIAEAGVNHNGDLELAVELVDVAAQAGADAVKFQTFRAERLVSPVAPKAPYQVRTTGSAESQLEMIRRLELPDSAWKVLQERARSRGVLFLSTPFDEESADLLDRLGVPAFKIPSGEITNLPFLAHLARKRKPLILSTGMASLSDVETAIETIEAAGASEIALLHCLSSYPGNPSEVNLRAMQTLAVFGFPVGYSDHTEGIEVALAAVALGAAILEKHFTLDKTLPGPDHQSSLLPEALGALARGVRIVESALGTGRKRPAPSESDTRLAARRSLVAMGEIPAGTRITKELITARRPGSGLSPALLSFVVGRRARRAIASGEVLTLEMLE